SSAGWRLSPGTSLARQAAASTSSGVSQARVIATRDDESNPLATSEGAGAAGRACATPAPVVRAPAATRAPVVSQDTPRRERERERNERKRRSEERRVG